MQQRNPASDAALAMANAAKNRYFNVRVLDDGAIIACHRLAFTTALIVDIDACGYAMRYCYPTEQAARDACDAMRTGDDAPTPGFIASRGAR